MPGRIRWRGDAGSIRSDGGRYSDEYDRSSYDSNGSYSTAPTAHSTAKPQLQKHDSCFGRVESHENDNMFDYDERRVSVETYASSDDSDIEEDGDDDEPVYEIVDAPEEQRRSDAIPATPRDFADLFPSARRLSIHHDDSTIDGNMNLRVDTLVETEWSSHKENLTLFHLKMNDLKSREFSLRRYCRDSGREVCKSIRKYHAPPHKPGHAFAKSFNNAFSHIKKHHDDKGAHLGRLQRNDSGYSSIFADGLADDASIAESKDDSKNQTRIPTNTIKFEFSNYANVELKRKGAGSGKAYQFEYWGHHYTWKRKMEQDGAFEEVSFHLMRDDKSEPLAHIVPVPLTREQARQEKLKGGWIAPCSMWITDLDVINGSPDVADLIIASGLVALVDDAIKRRWHSKTHRQVLLPLIRNNSFRLNMEYIGPRRLIDEVFNKRPISRAATMQHG